MFADPPARAAALAVTAIGAAAAGWLTARRMLGAELAATRHAATHDALTGITNRAGLTSDADALIAAGHAAGRPVVVLLVDLVGFKAVNDTHGHDAGDAILQAVAGRLANVAGPAGIAARLGGDEFAVITTGPPNTAADPHAWLAGWLTRLHARLIIPVDVDGRPLAVGATIGATLAHPDQPAAVWLTAADAAMYTARARRTTTAITTGPPAPPVNRPADRVRTRRRPTSRLAATLTSSTASTTAARLAA